MAAHPDPVQPHPTANPRDVFVTRLWSSAIQVYNPRGPEHLSTDEVGYLPTTLLSLAVLKDAVNVFPGSKVAVPFSETPVPDSTTATPVSDDDAYITDAANVLRNYSDFPFFMRAVLNRDSLHVNIMVKMLTELVKNNSCTTYNGVAAKPITLVKDASHGSDTIYVNLTRMDGVARRGAIVHTVEVNPRILGEVRVVVAGPDQSIITLMKKISHADYYKGLKVQIDPADQLPTGCHPALVASINPASFDMFLAAYSLPNGFSVTDAIEADKNWSPTA